MHIINTVYLFEHVLMINLKFCWFQAALEDLILRSLDIITIVVPPALPAAMTIGNNYSLKRLKKQQIYSTSVSLIGVWGKVKLICFDKVTLDMMLNLSMRALLH